MNSLFSLSAVILAGGASARMGAPKALLRWRGEPVAARLARIFVEACGEAWIVLGHGAAAVHAGLPVVRGARVVVNPDPGRGMLSSLQCGLRAARGSAGVFFLPVDYPAIAGRTIAAMCEAWYRAPWTPIMAPRHGGRRGHPVLVSRAVAGELLRLDSGRPAHTVIRASEERVRYVDVDDAAIHRDADDPESFAALEREFGR